MRPIVPIVAGLLLPLLGGCDGLRRPGPPVPLKSFVLYDVQGMTGDDALWVGEDRVAIVQVVGDGPAGQPGLWEKRYKAAISPEKWAEVERLVGAHHLLSVEPPSRPAGPDETHPLIQVVMKDGRTGRVHKWGGDKHADFDPVYDYLLGLCRTKGELVREGGFDWNWRPEGFEPLW